MKKQLIRAGTFLFINQLVWDFLGIWGDKGISIRTDKDVIWQMQARTVLSVGNRQ